MANADLKVTKVYVQDNKQIGYEVMRVDGSIIKVGRDQMVQAISLGHSYANATVSDSGVVRVSSDVPRKAIYTDSQDKNPLIYRNMHWHNILDLMESKDSKKKYHIHLII